VENPETAGSTITPDYAGSQKLQRTMFKLRAWGQNSSERQDVGTTWWLYIVLKKPITKN